MKDHAKTRDQLMDELQALRRENAALRALRAETDDTGPWADGNGNPCTETAEKIRGLHFDALPDPIELYSLDGRPTYVNLAHQFLFGWTPDVLESPDGRCIPVELQTRMQENVLSIARGDAVAGFDTRRRTSKGDVLEIRVSGSRWFGEDGRPAGVALFLHDITDTKKALALLRQSEEKCRSTIESLDEGYYEVDLDGNLVSFNESLCRIVGYRPEELAEMSYLDLTDSANAQKAAEIFSKVRKTGRPHKIYDYEIVRQDGEIQVLSISVSLVRDAHGNATGFRGICRNITDQKMAEKSLEASLKKFQAMYDLAVAMTVEHTLDQNLSLLVRQSRKLIHVDTSYVALRAEDTGEVYIHTHSGIRTEAMRKLRIPVGVGLGGKVAQNGKAIIVEDYFKEVGPEFHQVVQKEGLISGLAVPIQIGTTNLGVLYAVNRRKTKFGKSDVDTLSLLGNLAAVEITRYRMARQIQKARNDLERQVKERTRALEKANQELLSEIAERELAQQALRVSEEKYRHLYEDAKRIEELYHSLLNSTPDAIVIYDTEGRPTYVNDAFVKTLGWSLPEMIKERPLMSEFDNDMTRSRIQAVVQDGIPLSLFRTCFQTKFGIPVDVTLSASRFNDHEGSPAGMLMILRDITEQKRAEEALRESEERYRLLVDQAPVGIAVHVDGEVVFVNKAGATMLGADPGHFIGTPVLNRVHPEIRHKAREGIRRMLEDGRTEPLIEQKWLRADGSVAHVHVAASGIIYKGKPGIQAVFTDMSELKEARRELREEKEKFQMLLEFAPFGVMLVDPDGTFRYTNPTFNEIFGYLPAEIPNGRTWLNLALPDPSHRGKAISTWKNMVKKSRKREGKAQTYAIRCRDGTDKLVFFRPVRLDNGGHMVTCEDITELKRAETALHESEKRYRQLVENATDFIYLTDPDGHFTFVNPIVTRIMGMPEEEIVGREYLQFVHPDYRASVEEFYTNQFRKKISHTYYEFPIVTAQGENVWLGQSAKLVMDGDRIIQFQTIGRDITERKRAEQALIESEERFRQLYEESTRREELYRSLLNSSPDAVIIYDMEGHTKYVNPSFTRIFGWTMKELEGLRIPYVPYSEEEPTQSIIDGLVKNGTPVSGFETKRFTRDGRLLDVSLSTSRYNDHEGKPEGLLVVLSDISERKQAELELEQAFVIATQLRAEAEQASRAKSEFLANMSHELRTPLNAIIGFSELIQEPMFGSLTDDQKTYVSQILRAGEHLLQLINDILDLAKVESGKLELQLSAVSIGKILENSLIMIKEKAHKHRLRLEVDIAQELQENRYQADEIKLKQIMYNLLSNATKFTPDGGRIRLKAHRVDDDIVVQVSDTGIGLKSEDRDRVFRAFEQVDSSYGRQQQGTGLGLALTRRLVELHQGKIWAESEGLRSGSTFTVVLPARQRGGPALNHGGM